MRYFIYFSPTKSVQRVDIEDVTPVQDIIRMVQGKFGLKRDRNHQDKTSIVLNYNGSDLKPTWSLTDLGVPTGAIIRCVYRAKKDADLYVHCQFNNQLLELFDNTITINTTVAEIRKKISDRIGIPLSTFYVEVQDLERRRLYDRMKLFQCNLKVHDHIYVKVWPGYEDFLNACLKGFPKTYSHDDLTRHYQLQIALYIAAFYGYMELGNIVLQLGARSDHPVGEHPSRQWLSTVTTQEMPEVLKCPIHVAIERGQMKMVDLFVRRSLLCTQVAHPISGFLPYRFALSLSMSKTTKMEKACYKQIYLYLYDKQFNVKIPLNMNTTSESNVSRTHPVFFSLPRYCKIIRWYERAQTRVWKKYGVYSENSAEIKRAPHSTGLLGYKVCIDGFDSSFDSSANCDEEKLRTDRYIGYTEEEVEKLRKMRLQMKQSAAPMIRKKSRNLPVLSRQGLFGTKIQTTDFTPTGSREIVDQSNVSFSSISFEHTISQSTIDSVLSLQSSLAIPVENQTKNQINMSKSESSFTKSRSQTRSVSVQFNPNLKAQQATIKCYERYANASIHETAVQCLQEVAFLKRKSWIKQVEISKEMIKQRTKRVIQRGDDRNNSTIGPMRAMNNLLTALPPGKAKT